MKLMKSRRRARGISLIEVLVSMAIGLVVIGAVIVSYLGSGRASRHQSAYSQMDQDAQIGLNQLSRELQLAGYSQPVLTTNVASQIVMSSKLGTANVVFGCDTGFVDPTVATLACGTATTSAIEVVYEADAKNTVPTSTGIPTDCLGNGLTGVAPYIVHNRYLVQTGPSGRPELYCGSVSAVNTVQPLLENVENMRVWYGVQAAANSRQVVRYVTATDIGNAFGAGPTVSEWGNVISVRICLLMRSADPVLSAEDTRTYLDCGSASQTSNDNYLRRAYFTTATLRSKMSF